MNDMDSVEDNNYFQENGEEAYEQDSNLEPQPVNPLAPAQRIAMLDELRGFALLGILIMNIQSFGLIEAAYMNPFYQGEPSWANKVSHIFTHLFADMKMMTLFSMLFGAGILLFIEKAKEKTGMSMKLHFSRMFWLLTLGLIHAFLIWHGDILVTYAVCGMIVYALRNAAPEWLISVAIFCFVLTSLYFVSLSFLGDILTTPELARIETEMWTPGALQKAKEVQTFTGSYWEQLRVRVENTLSMYGFLIVFIWRVLGNMLLGMALYKTGIIVGKRSKTFYLLLALGGLILGGSLVSYGLILKFDRDFAYIFSTSIGYNINYWGSILVALGYVGLFGLWTNTGFLAAFRSRLSSVGRMAFSNYIMQSVICSFIFYGIGLSLFGQLEPYQLNFVVLGIWIIQLIVSPFWLKYYKFGPLEWFWRGLTYADFPFNRKR